MELSEEDIVLLARPIGGLFDDLAVHYQSEDIVKLGRTVEAEVRKQDEALIRQLVAALSLPCDRWNGTQSRIVREAISAGRAWLEATP